MSEGRIQQIGTPTDIYNEPINSFVADFIGESNILNGVMVHDRLVRFCEHEFDCVDTGFGDRTQVDVVIRPEDIYIFEPSDAAQLTGTVTSSIFKGVHYEMLVQTREGYELMVQDYHCFEAGREVGLLVKPFDIHVMKKERTCNTFEGKLLDETHVEFLGCSFECSPVQDIGPETPVTVEVDFPNVILEDNEEDGRLTGEVKFILYKGNHYHLTVFTDWDEDIFVDTNDVWDDGDRVGIRIAPAISHTKADRICQRHDKTGKSRRFQSDTVTAYLTRPAKTTHPYAKRTLQEFPNRLFQHAVIAQQLLHKLAKSSITAICSCYILYLPLHIFGRIAGRGAVTHQTQQWQIIQVVTDKGNLT